MRAVTIAFLISVLAPATGHAGPFCDQFRSASAEKQGAILLLVVDETLRDWPGHLKPSMTDEERLTMFADARRKMVSECSTGKDFAAGLVLGQDLGMYKTVIIENEKRRKNLPSP